MKIYHCKMATEFWSPYMFYNLLFVPCEIWFRVDIDIYIEQFITKIQAYQELCQLRFQTDAISKMSITWSTVFFHLSMDVMNALQVSCTYITNIHEAFVAKINTIDFILKKYFFFKNLLLKSHNFKLETEILGNDGNSKCT